MRQQRRTRDEVAGLVRTLGPGPWPVSALVSAGMTRSSMRRAVEAGRLVRVRRGVLALPDDVGDATTLLRSRARAALLAARNLAALSHSTASAQHSPWLPDGVRIASEPVHLTVPGTHDRERSGVRLHGSPLTPDDVTVVDGLRTTSVARTGVDVARGRALPDALLVLDSAARAIAARAAAVAEFREPQRRARAQVEAVRSLAAVVEAQTGWPGIASVRSALPWVDVGSESPFESSSRGEIHRAGLPAPAIAHPVQGASGTWWWVDFLWEEQGVVGEADGFGKYGTDPRDVAERLAAERHRQRDLEDAGWRVVRWDTREPTRRWLSRLARVLGVDLP